MLKKLKKYLIRLNFFNKKVSKIKLPSQFSDEEKIVRSIFSPINVSKDGRKLKANAFKTPSGIDEVSVNRLSFTTSDFCKKVSKEIESPENKRSYFGLALLYKKAIDKFKCNIVYSPLENNIFHSDIKIGYIPKKGDPLPAEFQYKVQLLASNSKLFKDERPDSSNWQGGEIE